MIEDMVRLQAQHVDLRNRELNLQEKQFDHQAKYADKVLATQAADLKDQRIHEGKQTTRKFIGGTVILVVVLAFLATCILTGHETVAIEIVKAVLYIGIGGGSGYAIGKNRPGQSNDAPPPDEP